MINPKKLKGIIFDMDGTLGDTLPVLFAAFRRAFLEHGGRWHSDAEIEGLFGQNEEGILRVVLPETHEAAYRTFLDEYERAHDISPVPFAGMTEILQSLQDRGVLIAVVTGKGDGTAGISMRRLGLSSYFSIVATGSARERVKAQCIRRVLQEWNIDPSDAAYVGDAVTDVIDARSSGVAAFAAAWASTAIHKNLAAANPDAVFESVSEFAAFLGVSKAD